MIDREKNIVINYTNWQDQTADRNIQPIEIWFGETKKYKQKQWFIKAIDIDKGEERNFPIKGINYFSKKDFVVNSEIVNKLPQINNLKEVKLYTDGGSRGNPGPSAIGIAIVGMDDNLVAQESKYLGITTNNQAEYQGLKQGLELCHKLGFSKVNVYMDSLLVVNQMKGVYKVKNRDLWPIYESVKDYLRNFSSVTFTHVPRELNKIADGMVNECLDNQID